METIFDRLFTASEAIRYVALYLDGKLESRERSGIKSASASESDKYEELIVNPTLLKLVKQRGNIDCGGARFVLIRYGNFFQLVIPMRTGHISVCIDSSSDVMKVADVVHEVIGSTAP